MLVCPFCGHRIKCASCNDYICESCGGDLLSAGTSPPPCQVEQRTNRSRIKDTTVVFSGRPVSAHEEEK